MGSGEGTQAGRIGHPDPVKDPAADLPSIQSRETPASAAMLAVKRQCGCSPVQRACTSLRSGTSEPKAAMAGPRSCLSSGRIVGYQLECMLFSIAGSIAPPPEPISLGRIGLVPTARARLALLTIPLAKRSALPRRINAARHEWRSFRPHPLMTARDEREPT